MIPEAFRVVAESMRVRDPQAQWDRLLERRNGKAPNESQWVGWLQNAERSAPDVAPPKEWQPPREWDEAVRHDPRQEIAARECANILAMLEEMTPKRPHALVSAKPDASNPLCVCAARAAMGFSTPCMACSSDTTSPTKQAHLVEDLDDDRSVDQSLERAREGEQ